MSSSTPARVGATGGRTTQHTTPHLEMTMTETPYTDDDLRTEAARQHASLTDDPDFVGVGEAATASLPAPADRAAVLRETADKAETFRGDWPVVAAWLRSLATEDDELRRMADEAQS
ncbi:hypothetical protein [Streptomyces alfalfae]